MSKIRPSEWKPIGVTELETAAEEVVRADNNSLVIAGPGAGKTELLAQRACYLLQTRTCKSPQRILATSFKRDAARNLHDRVHERCGSDLARQFDSMTFDAFAKSLVDRFRMALPKEFQLTSDYIIDFKLSDSTLIDRVGEISSEKGGLTNNELGTLSGIRTYWDYFIGQSLLSLPKRPVNLSDRASRVLWNFLLHNGPQSVVNFQMIARLAELILATNPRILKALRATYAYVFMDEFQDTTGIQYQLTKAAFLDSNTVISAVGDNKQRIMTWAGALDGVFADYERDFKASVVRLKNNYRSTPELVRIQSYLIEELDKNSVSPVSMVSGVDGDGECRVLLFEDYSCEAVYIAGQIKSWIDTDGLDPRDICILTRNRPGDYTEDLRSNLSALGIEARVESDLQDILSEPISSLMIHILRLATQDQAPISRSVILDLLGNFVGDTSEATGHRLEVNLKDFIFEIESEIKKPLKTEQHVLSILEKVLIFFDVTKIANHYPQYSQGDLLIETLKKFSKCLADYLVASNWPEVLDLVEGTRAVPIMTMHKSKGLEYNTVVFVGLEDSALWNFSKRQSEETCGFFVAFSRAKKRVLFTFCGQRPRYAGRRSEVQQRQSIGRLYELLESAGVVPEEITVE